MPEAYAIMEVGEKRPIYATATAPTGTFTVESGATVSVYDSTGTITAITGASVTGQTSGAAGTVQVYYNLDTTTPATLTAGYYVAVFSWQVTGSDTLTRTLRTQVGISIRPANTIGTYTYYPNAAELYQFLLGHGITPSQAMMSQLPRAQNAANDHFEDLINRKLLAPTATATRYFDPPVNMEKVLFLGEGRDGDLASFTSLVYDPTDATAETLTQNTDFVLEPFNALANGGPYTMVRFKRRWWGPVPMVQRRSIQITGRWGYSTTIGADVFDALLAGGASNVWTHVMQSTTGGRLGYKEQDISEDFGRAGVLPMQQLKDGWDAQFKASAASLRKWVP